MKSFPILGFFGLTKELVNLGSYINITENKSAVIENCKQIEECTDICAKVRTGSFEVEIWGNGLTMSNYSEECVEIRGIIEQVKLVSRRLRESE